MSIQGVLSRHAGATRRLPDPGRRDPGRHQERRIRGRAAAAHRGAAVGQFLGQQADRPAGDAGPGVGGERPTASPGRGTYPVAEEDRYVNHFGSVEELMALSLDTECQVISPLQRKVDVETASQAQAPLRRDLHRDVRPAALRHPVLLHLGLPAAADRATAGRCRRARLDRPPQPGDGHRADRRPERRIHHRRGAEHQRQAGAPAFAARHLGRDAGEPLLRIDRLYFDETKRTPWSFAVSYFDPEHYSYRVKLRRRSP